ncbi:MAG: LacI family DNA-binding transcriptional regulator [Opitutaceae bacterium]|jgi:DNA-binding LacI/PurR family transcriptional regulator|nr:LacI family DNA-binding transcriptional regulator [Opitutaceae bacterium]
MSVSMKEVARVTGVSVMTVSLSLRGDPSIPAATRNRILAAAKKLNYRKNPMVSALMSGLRRTRGRASERAVIAYIENQPRVGQHPSLALFRAGAAEAANALGFKLERFHIGETGLAESRLLSVLNARGITGVVFAPFLEAGAQLKQDWSQLAMAAIGFSLISPVLHRTVVHHAHAMQLALTELTQLGYRRIGFAVSPDEDNRVDRAWLARFLLYRYEHGGEAHFPIYRDADTSESAVVAWMEQQRPDAVLFTTYPSLEPLQALARRRGLAHVGLAHLHLLPSMKGCAGINQRHALVGAAAIDLVVEQLNSNQFGVPKFPKVVHTRGCWVPGASASGPGAHPHPT